MTLEVIAERAPLETDKHGVMRIAGTRIPLATIVIAFHQGVTAETMVQQYSSLSLADVYAVISYYLRHQEEVDSYLKEQQIEADDIRRKNEVLYNPMDIRHRLMARRLSEPV